MRCPVDLVTPWSHYRTPVTPWLSFAPAAEAVVVAGPHFAAAAGAITAALLLYCWHCSADVAELQQRQGLVVVVELEEVGAGVPS
jgi:hypothetical protein